MTMDKIIEELDNTVRLPGWRICGCRQFVTVSICSTGIKALSALKFPAVLADIDTMAEQIEEVARTVPGVASALAERLEGGRYINVEINREKPRVTV